MKDASLIVVASEDTYAVKQYLGRFKTKRVAFVPLPTGDDFRSSPADVYARLHSFKTENATQEHDQFWICIDQDHWADAGHSHNLARVLSHCHTNGYSVAISNPCFELWILLHFDESNCSHLSSCGAVHSRLVEILGGYNKAKCCGHLPFTEEKVHLAIERAKKLESDPDADPTWVATRVYLILEQLLLRESIAFFDPPPERRPAR